jgi:hypothetical protein
MVTLGVIVMVEKELKKYKSAKKIINENDLTESKTVKYRKNKKISIDVKYQKRLDTLEARSSYIEQYGVKNDSGSYTVGGNEQLIKGYMNKLYNILDSLGMPSDDSVDYKLDGNIVAFDSDEMGYRLGAYLMTERFNNIPNVHRIGWLLARFNNIKISLEKSDFATVANSLLFAIEEYSNIILISIEGDIVPHSTQAATQERVAAKQQRIGESHNLADKIKVDHPHLKTKSDLAREINKKTGWSFHIIRQEYLKDYPN